MSSIIIVGNWVPNFSCDSVWGVQRVSCTSAKHPIWRAFITIVRACGAARVGFVQVCAVDMLGKTPEDRFFVCYLGSQVVCSTRYRCATRYFRLHPCLPPGLPPCSLFFLTATNSVPWVFLLLTATKYVYERFAAAFRWEPTRLMVWARLRMEKNSEKRCIFPTRVFVLGVWVI